MKLLKGLLYVVLGLALLVIVMGLFARKKYRIERSIDIEAPQELVFEQIRLVKNYEKWSPWHDLDLNMKTSLEGEDGAVGTVYRWDGNEDVGQGSQRITAIGPNRIDLEVTRLKPWESTSPMSFELQDKSPLTHVTWHFDLIVGFPWNGLAMFTDVQKQVGKDFERGLGNLKKRCEHIMNPTYNGFKVAENTVAAQFYLGLRDTLPFAEVGAFAQAQKTGIADSLAALKLPTSGPAAVLTWLWDDKKQEADLGVGYPFVPDKKSAKYPYPVFSLPAGRTISVDFYGPYDSIGNAHRAIDLYLTEKKLKALPPSVESYLTNPAQEPDTLKWLTKVIYWVAPVDSTDTEL